MEKILATLISRNRRLLRRKILLTLPREFMRVTENYFAIFTVSFPEFAFCVCIFCMHIMLYDVY